MSTQRYTPEFKEEAVRQVVERGYAVPEVAARLGVSAHSLYKWGKAVMPTKDEKQTAAGRAHARHAAFRRKDGRAMKFTTPAVRNPIDQLKVVGKPTSRIEGRLKTTGTATYAYEHHVPVPDAAYGYIVGAGIAKGRIVSIDLAQAKAAPGVLAIVTAENAGKLGIGQFYVARALAGPEVQHYHQAVAIVVAETFEQARAAAQLVRVQYARARGSFNLEEERGNAPAPQPLQPGPTMDTAAGNFEAAFASAPVTLDEKYTTPDHSHAMMEPHASIAAWKGDKLTLWNAIQLVSWGHARPRPHAWHPA